MHAMCIGLGYVVNVFCRSCGVEEQDGAPTVYMSGMLWEKKAIDGSLQYGESG